MEQLIVIKYGELTTKKGNRNTFINALKNNIKRVLVNNDYNIIANRDHIYIETKEIDDVLSSTFAKNTSTSSPYFEPSILSNAAPSTVICVSAQA